MKINKTGIRKFSKLPQRTHPKVTAPSYRIYFPLQATDHRNPGEFFLCLVHIWIRSPWQAMPQLLTQTIPLQQHFSLGASILMQCGSQQ